MWRAVIVGVMGLALAISGIFALEHARADLVITERVFGTTPITVMHLPQAEGPVVVLAHGFAGSRPLMAAWQIALARAGYLTVSYDLEGHGANPTPMRGDVTVIEGTTTYLMRQLAQVTNFAARLPRSDGRVAYIGHSMSSDIVIRQALADDRVETVIALSVFSQAITPQSPRSLLMINGEWEGALRAQSARVMAELGVAEGELVGDPATAFARQAIYAPYVDHVAILYSRSAILATLAWLDGTFNLDRANGAEVTRLGLPILAALAGLVILGIALARLLPKPAPHLRRKQSLSRGAFWLAALVPMLVTPLALRGLGLPFMPVLVADYLALHLALYGLLTWGILWRAGLRPALDLRAVVYGALLAGYCLMTIGVMLDRYVADFAPFGARLPLLAVILIGAIVALSADAALIDAGRAPLWRRLAARLCFLASILIAVSLDFDRLMFLVIILPVILLFYLSFGLIGAAVGRRAGQAAMGLGLGVMMAWALAASFPLFDALA